MVLYKDYYDEYLNRVIPFTNDFSQFQRTLNGIRVGGGRDIPEAVYEALYEGAVRFPWQAESRIMILVGDAPPHPRQRGKISKEMTDREVAGRDIKVNAIILPQ
jgi:Mg-chelatase subunit ChlD